MKQLIFSTHCVLIQRWCALTQQYLHMKPQFEKVTSDKGQGTGVVPDQLQILLCYLPAWRVLPCEQSWIVQVALCGMKCVGREEVRMSKV